LRFDDTTPKSEQIQAVLNNKLTSKKRQGVVSFVKYFPTYVSRVENQLIGVDGLEIRASVDMAYEKIVQTMFDSLKQMAKMNGDGDEKGQLNYHVILIGAFSFFKNIFCGIYGRGREYASFCCRNCVTRNRLNERLLQNGRGYI
jgi:Exocyst complex component Sec3